ncbi:MAG: AFG1 family ATPase [Rhizobiaceae bacterium]|nr:AFG1 family ATPase [Rhizobiaceae bacterium]
MHVRDGIQTHATVAGRYRHLVDTGAVEANPAQQRVAEALDRLIAELAEKRLGRKSSALGWLLARNRKPEPVRGLYIHGGVGAGKTMLMDMFHDLVPVRRKRRVHFNDFMADVHDRIQRHRQARKDGTVREDDPIPPVARALAEQAWVLCFDEFSVTDIADAMILSRLFSALFAEGVVLVATSNVAPDDLYRDGLNRQLFLPFVDILKRNAEVMALDAGKDYRMEKLARLPVYITPAGAAADARMDETWDAMTRGSVPKPAEIEMKGRVIPVPRAAGRAARFSFADLCEAPLAARDYLAIVERFDTIFVDRIPLLVPELRNPTKRLILLVDVLYDKRVRLVASAATPPQQLYAGRPKTTEAFEFERTASRLIEMQGRDWLEDWQRHHAA